jgi:hypothetical protein
MSVMIRTMSGDHVNAERVSLKDLRREAATARRLLAGKHLRDKDSFLMCMQNRETLEGIVKLASRGPRTRRRA